MSKNSELVIVGAGPVGLWAAIQSLQRRPDLNVTLYERHTEYQRSHVLRLEMLSTVFYSSTRSNRRKDQFYEEIFDKSLSQIFQAAATGYVFIRTNDLEQALKSYAQDMGAQIVYERVNAPDELMTRHENCKTFIAADGSHSPMRTALLGADAVKTTPLQYIAELKYQAEGKAGRLELLRHQYKTHKVLSSLAFEYVGNQKEDVTPVSLRFFLDKKTSDAIPDATFKEPLRHNDERLPLALAEDIRVYMKARELHAGEVFKEGSDKLTKLTLSAYVADRWAVQKDDRAWFLVGDSAMGVPYFRALNSGFFVGSQLGFILTREWMNNANKVRAYNAVRPFDKAWEFTLARSKNGVLQAYDLFRQASAASPLEFFKLGREERDEILKPADKAVTASNEPQP